MAQTKNKKRRSRKRARTAQGGGTRSSGAASSQQRVTKAQRAQKAREAQRAAPGAPSVKADRSEAPAPIWAPLPITEGLILFGLIGAVAGLVTQSTGLLVGGILMIVVSSLELSVREHLAGYRSHTTLISSVVALGVAAAAAFGLNAADVGLPQWPLLFVAILIFAGMFRLLREQFRVRSGGLTYRV